MNIRTSPTKVSFLSETQKAAYEKYAFGMGVTLAEFLLFAGENYITRNEQGSEKKARGERIYDEVKEKRTALQQRALEMKSRQKQ